MSVGVVRPVFATAAAVEVGRTCRPARPDGAYNIQFYADGTAFHCN